MENGHDVSELVDLFTRLRQQRRGKPRAIILNTVKGKKVGECQYNPNWHTSTPRSAQGGAAWLRELWLQDGERLGVPESFAIDLGDAISIVPPIHDNPDQITDRQA